jgi:O-antigen/teichoic acid export membrane protein
VTAVDPQGHAGTPRRALSDLLRPDHQMLRAGYSLITNVIVTALLGFGFWIAAARLFPSTTVGRDTVLVAAMLTLSAMCQLNLTTVMLRFLPVTRLSPRRFIATSYAIVATLSLIAGSAFVIAAPNLSSRLGFLHSQPWVAVGFIGAVVVWGIFSLQDAVLTAFRRTAWVPIENGLFGAMKIAMLPILLVAGAGHAVFLAWAIAMALLIIPVNALIFRSVIPNRPARPDVPSPVERFGRAGLARFSMHDLGGTLFGHASSTMLPVVMAAFVGSAESAYFYMPFMVVATFDLMFLNVAAALTVEGAATERRIAALARLTVRRFAPLLLAGIAVVLVGAPALLELFGPSYSESGTTVLRLLVCASAFRAATALYSAVCRVEGRGSRVLAIQGSTFALVISLTLTLAPAHGIGGVATAWLLANALVAVAVAPALIRLLRRGGAPPPQRAEGVPLCATSV